MINIARTRGMIYCSVCDAHQQKFIDITTNKIHMEEKFCFDLLKRNEFTLKFMHVLLVEYIEVLFTASDCFNGDPTKTKNENIENILDKYKKRIPLVNNCFQNLNMGDFMKHCWFLCHSYSINKISNFFDGEMEFLRNTYLSLYSFVREHKYA